MKSGTSINDITIMFGVDLKLNDYQFLKDKGICVKCRKAKADYGYVSCLQCRMDEREYKKMYYHNKMTDEQKKEIQRKNNDRRKQHREQHLCETCSKPTYRNTTLCYECLIKKRKKSRVIRESQKIMKAQNQCRIKNCYNERIEGRCYCDKHLDKLRLHAEYMRSCRNMQHNQCRC